MTFDWTLYNGGNKWLRERTIYVTRHGSHAYGTAISGSDHDYRGIAVAPMHYYLGFANRFEQMVQNKPVDLTIFELQKFMKLAADANPNALEILFTDPSDHLFVHPVMQPLLDAREAFLSKKTRKTFAGYARAQLRRLQKHCENLPANPDRADLVTRHGYDTKHAMHLVRLTRMCRELLETGKVNVRRPDVLELIGIRNGSWTYEQLIHYSEVEDAKLDELTRKSSLPDEPDRKRLDKLCVDLIRMFEDCP